MQNPLAQHRPPHVTTHDEWLWGWDPTPHIVSVWAEPDGRALVWRRIPETGVLLREEARFRPWLLLSSLVDLTHLGARLLPEGSAADSASLVTYRELEGPGALRYLVRAEDARLLANTVLRGAAQRLGRAPRRVRDLGPDHVLVLPLEEQYLVASGRTYFRDLPFDALARLQFDLETTGLDPDKDRIFLVALRAPSGASEVLEAEGDDDAAEAALISRLVQRITEHDPDVVENHNLHGFDLPFLARRARSLAVPLALGRFGPPGLRQRPAARGPALALGQNSELSRRARYTTPGREWIDTMDAVRRYDFATRELASHGLKSIARHFGVAAATREYVPGSQVYEVYRRDPARIRRYACDDVNEVAQIARLLGGAAFALARMAPRRYERLADAGPATGVLDPLLVRAYVRASAALPGHEPSDGTSHSGAALYLFATGVAERIVKADVASLYPSLMCEHRIGPQRDRLGVLLRLVDRLVEQRLAAKAQGRAAAPGSAERHTCEALSAAMKLVVNSAYGYLGAVGLTRFADVHAANEVTRRGREVLDFLCRELARRGVTLLEADTDGVYFSMPDTATEPDERRLVAEVAAQLPARVKLEFDGRYAAMLSHEPKNYALLSYTGALTLRGVAFRSSRAEAFGEEFLRQALGRLLRGDVAAVREVYLSTIRGLRQRTLPTLAVTAQVRLTKTPEQYAAQRERRRELPYEALLVNGRTRWFLGERIRIYRANGGRPGLWVDPDGEDAAPPRAEASTRDERNRLDPRDYDIAFYLRLLRETFAARLERGLTHADFDAVFADPDQLTLFAPDLTQVRPILSTRFDPLAGQSNGSKAC